LLEEDAKEEEEEEEELEEPLFLTRFSSSWEAFSLLACRNALRATPLQMPLQACLRQVMRAPARLRRSQSLCRVLNLTVEFSGSKLQYAPSCNFK